MEKKIVTVIDDFEVFYYVYHPDTYNSYIGTRWDTEDFEEGWQEVAEFSCSDIDELITYFLTHQLTPVSAGVHRTHA